MEEMEKRELISTGEAGKVLGVSRRTILAWYACGRLKEAFRLPSGHLRVKLSELIKIKENRDA